MHNTQETETEAEDCAPPLSPATAAHVADLAARAADSSYHAFPLSWDCSIPCVDCDAKSLLAVITGDSFGNAGDDALAWLTIPENRTAAELWLGRWLEGRNGANLNTLSEWVTEDLRNEIQGPYKADLMFQDNPEDQDRTWNYELSFEGRQGKHCCLVSFEGVSLEGFTVEDFAERAEDVPWDRPGGAEWVRKLCAFCDVADRLFTPKTIGDEFLHLAAFTLWANHPGLEAWVQKQIDAEKTAAALNTAGDGI